jgi:hypothetical protein
MPSGDLWGAGKARSSDSTWCIHTRHLGPNESKSRSSWLRRWAIEGLDTDAKIFAVCFLILLPFYWAPLFVTAILPGLDLPFHLALADMLGKAGSPESPYAPYYDGGLRIAPYAAHYILLIALGKVMNLLLAHKLIVAAYVAGLPLATASLLAGCGRSRIPALLAFPLAYNLTLHYGFISFALSLPVLMLLLAQMVRHLLTHGRRVWWTWLWTAASAVALFLCHLQNFLYGVGAALAFALFAPLTWRRRLLAASSVLPALAAQAFWQFVGTPSTPGSSPKTSLAFAWEAVKRHRMIDLGRQTWLQDFWGRIEVIPSHAMRAFDDQVNITACKEVLILIGVYLVAGVLAWILLPKRSDGRPWLRAAPGIFVAFLGALTAYLVLPHHLQELELMTFFPRFAVLVVLMGIALIPAGLSRVRGVFRLLLPVPALVIGILYGYELTTHYRAFGQETEDFVTVMNKTPAGGKVLGAIYNRHSRTMRIESVLVGLVDYYVALRPAPESMAPLAYCGMRHMPCTRKPAGVELPDPWIPQAINPLKTVPDFDYFFMRSLPPGADPFGPYRGSMELLAQSGTWSVFHKKPGPLVMASPPPPPKPVPAPAPVVKAAEPAQPVGKPQRTQRQRETKKGVGSGRI